MHVIWKRPDGFHNAQPEDFRRIALSNGAQLWLHRRETDWYPFQVSGDWAGQEQTKRLNRLINLLDAPDAALRKFIEYYVDEEFLDLTLQQAVENLCSWVEDLKTRVRGNTWEVEIVLCALNDVIVRLRRFSEEASLPH